MHKNDEPVLLGPPLGLGPVLKKINENSLWHEQINFSVAAENYWELVENWFYALANFTKFRGKNINLSQ